MQPYILSHFSQVCIHLLNHYFGEAVGKVGSYLLRRGNRPMFEIPDVTGLHLREVLLKHAQAFLLKLALFVNRLGKL